MRARKVDEYSKTLDRRGIGKRSRCYGVRLLMAQKSSPGLIEVFSLRWRDMCHALAEMPRWERAFHIFWLLGPFVLLTVEAALCGGLLMRECPMSQNIDLR